MAGQRFLVDEGGDRVAVLLDIDEYRHLLAELEDLDSIRAYDAAKAAGDQEIPLAQALREIEATDE